MRILGVVSSSSREVPNAPTIGTATDVGTSRAFNNGAATVTFTAPTFDGGLPITGYTVTSSPSGFTATGAASPLTVAGLASSTAYTFTAVATNSRGNSTASSASNSITATTVPQAPTIGTATDGGTGSTVSVAFTPGATGGKAVSTYTATSSPGGLTGTGASSPITVSGLTTGTAYTFTVTATNANGTSASSAASNSVTPAVPTSFDSIASVVTTGQNTVTFSSIPSTYKHLQIRAVMKFRNIAGSNDLRGVFNSSSSGNGAYHYLQASGGMRTVNGFTNSGNGFNAIDVVAGNTNNGWGVIIIDILDYANTSKNKTTRYIGGQDSNGGNTSYITMGSSLWPNTAAISDILLSEGSGNGFLAGTTFSLYGIKG